VINNTLPILNSDGSVNTSNVNNLLKLWSDNSIIISKFAAIRLIYNNLPNIPYNTAVGYADLYIQEVNVKSSKYDR
jgi:hypothetical protein